MGIIKVDEILEQEDRTRAEETWARCYKNWHQYNYAPVTEFTEIEFKAHKYGHPRFMYPIETVDWLNNRNLDEYRTSLVDYKGRYLEETRKGTLHTANLLFDALQASTTEPDLAAAVWIAAWCESFHQDSGKGKGWNYEHHMLITNIAIAARNHLAHSPTFASDMMPNWWGIWWHHAMREILPGLPPTEMFSPTTNIAEIVRIIGVSATVVTSTHTLIHAKAT
jgi:hypothetical protein